uniref:uncharacterized protein LOC131104577 isoform X2 n=1 Tax=Doryrhamphus excisus TaxID=161450 RepID=UPI0025AEAEB7|nr:uncharacterized protein LOC131104577 isoform X2 [Doryrhamphus excisus]
MSLFWSVSILAVLHLTSRGNGEDCPLRILGQQKTVFKAPVGAHLQISCTIQNNCSKEFEKVSWYRLESYNLVPVTNDSGVITILEHISNLENTLLLRFTNIQKRDAGLYRCQGGLAVGHPINVSVHDNPTTINSSSRNETSSAGEAQWILVYSALGTVAFVFTVISLSVLSMRKGHPKRRTQMENQANRLRLANNERDATLTVTKRRQLHLQPAEQRERRQSKQEDGRRGKRHRIRRAQSPAATRWRCSTMEAQGGAFRVCSHTRLI